MVKLNVNKIIVLIQIIVMGLNNNINVSHTVEQLTSEVMVNWKGILLVNAIDIISVVVTELKTQKRSNVFVL